MTDIHSPSLVIAAGAVLPTVCISLVGLRFYTRRLQKAQYETDDWLAIPAVVSSPLAVMVSPLLGESNQHSLL